MIKRILPVKEANYLVQEFSNTTPKFSLNFLLDVKNIKGNLHQEVIQHYLNHEFNLLGSGWVCRNTKHPLKLNIQHQSFYDKALTIISKKYKFINWQLDIKSGFEFDVAKQFNQQITPQNKNIDIKNCWELGRLQHLSPLAVSAINSDSRQELVIEFKNQTLDFIVSNPIGMGVQWACTMDVGIRVANLLLAYDIFKQIDDENILNNEFTHLFSNTIYQHGLFIYHHLEHKEGLAGNHYLFNLLGLLFVANYLVDNEKAQIWKAFAIDEIAKEFEKQFFDDGGNFEGSTTYHCLSTEAMMYATALMLRNDKQLSEKYVALLYKAACFIKNIVKPNREIPQFGDNDSGRLFKLNNEDENLLNYESLLAGFAGLFEKEFDNFSIKYPINKLLITQLSNHKTLKINNQKSAIKKYQFPISNYQYTENTKLKFSTNIETEQITQFVYPTFGIYIFKSPQFYLAISAIANKNMHHSWGHVHNDKLSFDLQVNGKDIVKDAGTYTYTAFPIKRNEFRSDKAHHGIVVEGKTQNKVIDLFYLEREVKCQVLAMQNLTITLQVNYYGVEHIRKFTILAHQLIITDYCNKAFKVNINKFAKYSPNYGTINETG